MLVSLSKIHKYYNGREILHDVNLTINEGERIGLVGANGCGKTTLLRILTGKEEPDRFVEDDGVISRASKVTVGYLEQMGGLERSSTVYAEMRSVFADVLQAADRMRELEAQMHGGLEAVSEEYTRLTAFFESRDGYLIDVKIKTVLNGMGFGEDTYDRIISSFSGGEKTRLAIAKLLVEEPNLLILDEPTNHLDLTTKEVLEEALASYTGTILFVSHDRYLLNRISDKILEITPHRAELFPGNFDSYLEIHRQREQQAQLEADAERQRRAAEEAKERGAKVYRTREQRSREAQRRNRIRTLEQEIDGLEQELQELQEQLGTEQVCGDYKLMQQICDRIEQVKTETEEKFEELMELEDEA